ncbi:5'/3'-nucleotidase SurE [Desulfosarcina alkanivorans]|uniref:5'-nucleotidase n=1 Tax=Desulfosarcina alkanivorans TaxID=571177 RepID=A0A5K7YXS2_9BACT|nr:5'/3'-nucleotidase SurE [Desulfosarcina alkanivorans]BBO69477.1 5'/3'-nucleotidase SurE [Desulfosarcina alkanivorans]
MKIVVTNDDGYDQPGLAALVEAVKPLGEITVVAPATPQSNVGHRVTMRDPIRVDRVGERTYVVHATPADCTRLAVKCLVPDVDWVVAGINPGANLGSDVYQSGTVAATREAAILGIRAAAVSQYIGPDVTVDWPAAQAQSARCLQAVWEKPLAAGQFWNINLPSPISANDVLAHRLCPLDKHPHRYRYVEAAKGYRYQGIIHDRPRAAGSDVDVCFGGMIAVTRMEI